MQAGGTRATLPRGELGLACGSRGAASSARHLQLQPTARALGALAFLLQVSWYSFHFLAEELAEQLAELHAAVNAVLARLPE